MQLTLPDELPHPTGRSDADLRFDLAVGLFRDGRLTLGRAAGLASLAKPDFLDELGRRRIPMPYDEHDLAADLQTLRELFPPGAPCKT